MCYFGSDAMCKVKSKSNEYTVVFAYKMKCRI